MELDKVGLSVVSAVLPAGVSVGEIPVPEGIPVWMAALIVALGPSSVAFLSWAGKAVVQIAAAYFKKKSEYKKAKAEAMLKDSNKSNDLEAIKLKLEAEAEYAAAHKAEEIASKMSAKKGE
jgi:hypothetical protein